jgi:hypothetical protein
VRPSAQRKLLPGEVNDAVALAKRETAGTHMLTYGEYRKVARALVQTNEELTALRREVCPKRSQPHVVAGNDCQCTMCLAYIPRAS